TIHNPGGTFQRGRRGSRGEPGLERYAASISGVEISARRHLHRLLSKHERQDRKVAGDAKHRRLTSPERVVWTVSLGHRLGEASHAKIVVPLVQNRDVVPQVRVI